MPQHRTIFNFYGDVMELTRFEKTRVLAARALQIAMGAPILIKTGLSDPKEIAKAEFLADVLPITVRRPE